MFFLGHPVLKLTIGHFFYVYLQHLRKELATMQVLCFVLIRISLFLLVLTKCHFEDHRHKKQTMIFFSWEEESISYCCQTFSTVFLHFVRIHNFPIVESIFQLSLLHPQGNEMKYAVLVIMKWNETEIRSFTWTRPQFLSKHPHLQLMSASVYTACNPSEEDDLYTCLQTFQGKITKHHFMDFFCARGAPYPSKAYFNLLKKS